MMVALLLCGLLMVVGGGGVAGPVLAPFVIVDVFVEIAAGM